MVNLADIKCPVHLNILIEDCKFCQMYREKVEQLRVIGGERICSAHQTYNSSCKICHVTSPCPYRHDSLQDDCIYCKAFAESEERKENPLKRAEYYIRRGDIGCPECKTGVGAQCNAPFEHSGRHSHHARYVQKLALQLLECARELHFHDTGYDCDSDGHKYNTGCRKCDAHKQLEDLTIVIDDLGTQVPEKA